MAEVGEALPELATLEMSSELNSFYEQFTLKSSLEFRPHRPQSFFSPYQLHSSEHDTYVLRGEQKEIQGIASFIYRDVLIEGRAQKIAFATDLRVSNHRKPLLEWSQKFLPVIRDIYSRKKVAVIFSAISREDALLHNVFLRPRSPKRAWPRYYLYRKFDLVTLHGQYPWANKAIPSIKIEEASSNTKSELLSFLLDRAQYYPFSSFWDEKSFDQFLARLPGMKLSDLLIARNAEGKVIGSMGSWSSLSIQQYRPISYSLRAHNFRQFLKFGRLFGWSRPLTKPVASTGVEAPLHFRHLVLPYVFHEDVFEALLYATYQRINRDEFLLYGNAEPDFRRKPPMGWIAGHLPYALYALLPPEAPVPSFLDPNHASNPELEAYYFI